MVASTTDVPTILQIEAVFAHMSVPPHLARAMVPSLALQIAQELNNNATTPLILTTLAVGGCLNSALQGPMCSIVSVEATPLNKKPPSSQGGTKQNFSF